MVRWEAKPVSLSLTCCWKPFTTQTETIITAKPTAMPAVAMRMAGVEARRWPLRPVSLKKRLARKRESIGLRKNEWNGK